ncbi:MAG: hypothetical protein R3321_13735, partial [Nitrososphaeraceae archaeon]|nr:hypothetical protein [Nitrososphaeraceae archaeon]
AATKKAINEKIFKLESLNKDEYLSLISSINTLYNDLSSRHKSQGKNSNNTTCLQCKNTFPENSRFCNKCGCSIHDN